MADYSQPPFGMPFPIPPQHPPHAPSDHPANAQNGSSDPRQPNADSFQFNTNLPGLNLHSYTQNSQQLQYPYWPPPPAPQPTAFGAVPYPPPFLFQNGVPIPPPPPGSTFFPPVPQLPSQNAPAPSPISPQPSPTIQAAPRSMTVAKDHLAGMMDSDKEDGEISEEDGGSKSSAVRSKPIVELPRSVPPVAKEIPRNDSQNGPRRLDSRVSDYQFAAQAMHHPPSTTSQKPAGPRTSDTLTQKREEAKKFVKVLYEYNIGYPSLAAEGLDPQLLREFYQEMNLPSQPEPIPAPPVSGSPTPTAKAGQPALAKSDASATKTNWQNAQPDLTTAVRTKVNTASAVKSASSPADRKDYIARLQAAKMGKQSMTAKAVPPQGTPVVKQPSPTAKPPLTSPTNTVANGLNGKPPLTEEEKARKNELLRKRLELLKANEMAKAKQKMLASKPGTPQASADAFAAPLPPVQKSGSASQHSPKTAQAAEDNTSAQPVRVFQVSSFPKLPGLFMNSTPALSTQASPMAVPNSSATISRNRPVASDLDEVTTPRSSGPVYTRPLGQSPHEHDAESMIIEVSDDDSGGSEMDLDDDQAILQTSVFTPPSKNRTSNPAIHHLPGLTDFPSRSGSARPASSAISTPPPIRTPASLQTQAEINRIEREALTLKLKIAEMSRNRKATAARKDAIASALQKSDAAPEPEQPSGSPQPPALLLPTLSDSAATHYSPQTDGLPEIAAGPAKSGDWKKQRRGELELILQSLDAEMENERCRLAQLQKEMADIAVNKQKRQHNREKLVQELESLGIDTEGMPDDELQAHKEEIEQVKETQSNTESLALEAPMLAPMNVTVEARDFGSISEAQNLPTDSAYTEGISMESGAVVSSAQVSLMQSTAPSEPLTPDVIMSENVPQPPRIDETSHKGRSEPQESEPPIPIFVPTETVVGPVNGQDYATPLDDSEDFYSPEPAIAPPVEHQPKAAEPAQGNAKSPSEEGEVEMSESSSEADEEEYEPDEPQVTGAHPVSASEAQQLDMPNSPNSSVLTSSMPSSENEGELYEPLEPGHVMHEVEASAVDANVPGGRLAKGEQGAMDIAMSNKSRSNQWSPPETADMSISQNNTPNPLITLADNLAPELQSQEQASVAGPLSENTVTDPTPFIPYESPLRMFKSYRYHPQFPQEVAGGFASKTYSHQIDPEKPLCRFESVGETCNDPHCDGQHFRDMNISGEKLLVQLGTANPGKTPEEKQQWNDGLRLVLRELRQNNIKDPNGIAMEIAKYRRQFFNDDTRVVNL